MDVGYDSGKILKSSIQKRNHMLLCQVAMQFAAQHALLACICFHVCVSCCICVHTLESCTVPLSIRLVPAI